MFLLLELIFLVVVALTAVAWRRVGLCGRRLPQFTALLLALTLFYPCISLADDLLAQQQPAEVADTASIQKFQVSDLAPAAVAAPPVREQVTVSCELVAWLPELPQPSIPSVLLANDHGLRSPPAY